MRVSSMLFSILIVAASLGAQAPVRIASGLVKGTRDSDLTVYKGIPFAAPPVGPLRWKAPQPAPRWSDVRDANAYGARCAQVAFPPGTRPSAWSEDCLTLNVWTPAEASTKSLPVLVIIPGGGFFMGGGDDPLNLGANFAKRGVVVVSFNYRLGVFGFFAHPALSKESPTHASGNYGLMDQIAALQWVRNNIAAFGGDPRNVTITGSSAGGSSVLYLMVSPPAQGLFVRAIAESAALVYGPLAHLTERRYGRESREAQGLALGADIGALRALSATELFDKAGLLPDIMFTDGPNYWAFVDGVVLPDEPSKLFDAGKFARVPLLIGTAADEGSVFALLDRFTTTDAWNAHLARRHPGAEAAVQAAYPVVTDTGFYTSGMHWVNDWYFHGTARAVARAVSARGVPVYLFDFSYALPFPPLRGRAFGAAHSSETQYAYGNLDPRMRLTAVDTTLSRAMGAAWQRFVITGDPNGSGLPSWPRYQRATDQHMEFNTQIRAGVGLHGASLDAFDKAFAVMRANRVQ